MQKIYKDGNGTSRFFWNVETDKTAGEYRSRHSTVNGVRTELTKHGHKVKSVAPVKA